MFSSIYKCSSNSEKIGKKTPTKLNNIAPQPLCYGKSGVLPASFRVRVGTAEEDMHYLSVQRKWGESGQLKFMEIYGFFPRP